MVWRSLTYAGISLLVVVVFGIAPSFWLMSRVEAPPPGPAAGEELVSVSVVPSTLVVAQSANVRIQVDGDLPGDKAVIQFSGLGFQRELTPEEVKSGVSIPLRPDKLGTYEVRLQVDGKDVARAPITVGLGPELGRPPKRALEIKAGLPRPATDYLFVLPVYVITHVARGESTQRLVPKTIDSDLKVAIRGDGVAANTVTLVPRGSAQSDAVNLPFEPGASYTVTAYAAGYEASKPLKVAWQDHKDLLALHVEPARITRYATPATKAELQLYLTHEGRLIRPPKAMMLLANRSQDITGPPTIELSSASGLAAWEGRAARDVRDGTVEFIEPLSASRVTAQLTFVFPWLLLIVAAVTGIVGVIAARRSGMLAQSKGWLVLELFAAATGGLLLYLTILQGWTPWVSDVPSLIGWPSALAIGVIGGYGGEGTFQLILKAVKWINPTGA